MTSLGRRVGIIVHDIVVVALAWALAQVVRHNFVLSSDDWQALLQSLPVVMVAQAWILWHFRLYKGLWRFTSVVDLWNILRAVFFGTLAASLALFLFNRLYGVPRTTFVLYPLFLVFLLGAPRTIYRLWKDYGLTPFRLGNRQRVLILGAGRAGEMLARDMLRGDTYLPVGFLDDKASLLHTKLHGVPVVGPVARLSHCVRKLAVDLVVIGIPSATGAQMRAMVEQCEQAGVPFRTLPRLQDMPSGLIGLSQLREVAIEDLLEREPVVLDWKRIDEGLAGKVILVSGGGGSIGAELCHQLARLHPRRLIVFERCEFNLYAVTLALHRLFPRLPVEAVLGDVTDADAVERSLRLYRPQVIFHAAAYKHVPLLEGQPREAIRNNILGTRTLAAAADRHGVETFIMISTDKAVNPTNVMGATKRAAELFCQALNSRSSTCLVTVRFGNVLDSTGSVVPLFRQQIAAGGPVTVTHPEVTRFFMTISEACQLIMQAAVMGQGGETFVLDMGEPVRIRDLAEQMIRLSGKVVGKDIAVIYTGLRAGEKLHEELFYGRERCVKTEHEKIWLAHSPPGDWARLNAVLDALEHAHRHYDDPLYARLLKELIPELSVREDEDEPSLAPPDNVVAWPHPPV